MPARGSVPAAPRMPDDLPDLDALDTDLDVYRARLVGDHSGAVGGGEIAVALVDGADLSASRFDPLTLTDVTLRRTDLSNAGWDGLTARRVLLDGCRTVGWRVNCVLADDLLVQDCRWEFGALYLHRARGAVVFRDCTFTGSTLRGDLSGVVFDGCELAGAELAVSAAQGCDLRTSRLDGARGLTTLRGARITTDQAVGIADLIATEVGFQLDDTGTG
ncbi:MAG TPA: hypothetical protein VGR21_04675 [Cryptosporangiaceae bacterium]|nr:hypothetical protein [Cryptosporangiaceae bacterium]